MSEYDALLGAHARRLRLSVIDLRWRGWLALAGQLALARHILVERLVPAVLWARDRPWLRTPRGHEAKHERPCRSCSRL